MVGFFVAPPRSMAASLPATSYANSGGTGDRTGIITATTTATIDEGVVANIINGNISYNATGGLSTNSGASSGVYFRFDFGTAKYINEAKFYGGGGSNGVWQWQGSDDASSWTNIGSTFTLLAGIGGVVQGDMSANAALYRYYQILGVSGNLAGGEYAVEFEFKIGA